MANSVRFKASIDDQVSGKLGKMRDQFDRLGKSKGAMAVLQGVGVGVGVSAMGALSSAIGNVTQALSDSVAAAAADELSQARLYTAVEQNSKAWDGNREAVEAVLKERMALAFSDEEQRDSLSLLVAKTGDVTEALNIQRTAMDLARLKGIDLATASRAIALGMEGQGRALKELGINVAELTNKQEVLGKVQEKAGGQAEAYADTAQGAFETLQITMDELAETVGYVLLPYLKDLAKTLRDDVLPNTDKAADAMGLLGQAMGLVAAPQKLVADGAFRLSDALDALGGDAQAAGRLLKSLPVIGDEVRAQQEAAAASSAAWSARLNGLARSLSNVGEAADDTGGDLEDVGGEAKDAAKDFRKLEGAVNDALDALIEASLGPKQLKTELAIAKDELGENQRALDKLKNTKNLTGEQRDEIRQLKLRVLEGKEEVIRLTARLTSMGKISLADLRSQMSRLGIGLGNSADEAARLLANLRALPGVSIPSGGGGGKKHGASGGFARPGETWEVGESGRETVYMGRSGALIVPNGGGGGGQPAPVNLAVYLDSEQIAARVERRQYFAASVAPVSAR